MPGIIRDRLHFVPPPLITACCPPAFSAERYPANPTEDPDLWCFAEDPGNEYIQLKPFPCKKEACPRYRAEFPHCVMMSRNYSHARDYP